jgi:hypothetical protein
MEKGYQMKQFKKALQEMYELGVEHGIELGLKDAEIKQLNKEIEELKNE